jgi:undecaprenyl-diphosphatase
MTVFDVFILSVVEGITEFLPVSSTGHLILFSRFLEIENSAFLKTFEIVIQLGAIMAVLVLYSGRLMLNFKLLKKVIFAFLPTAVVGFTLYPLVKNVFLESSWITLNALFWGGVALIGIEYFLKSRKGGEGNLNTLTYRQAVLIGTFQAFSIIPGVSRAAATIIGGLLVGANRKSATEFSFLLAIPTMFAASLFDLYKTREVLIPGNMIVLFTGATLSFIFALFAVKLFVGYVEKNNFIAFGVYRILIALAFWIFIL